jgi:hypothetical protein
MAKHPSANVKPKRTLRSVDFKSLSAVPSLPTWGKKYGTLLCAASSISPSAGLSDPYHFAHRELGPVRMDEFALKFFALLSGVLGNCVELLCRHGGI